MSPRRILFTTFRSLRVRNYRLYLGGQLVSLTGTWMQVVAQNWLVLRLTNSGVAIGITTGLQFVPTALAGMWGGLLADRLDKRRILLVTQAASGALALALGVLTLTGSVRLWMVYLLAFLLGCVTVVDAPTRQAFVMEMVGPSEVPNAVGLNSATFNAARIVGPALAAAAIASIGLGWAFLINAASYVAVIAGLLAMNTDALHREEPVARAPGQLREGLRYAWGDPGLRATLLLVAVVATLGFNFNVVIPLMARFVFHGGAGSYAAFTSIAAVGALFGALSNAGRRRPTLRRLTVTGMGFGVFAIAASAAGSAHLEGAALLAVGASSMAFLTTANSSLQLGSPAAMRGRIMSLYTFLFLGSSAVGGPLVGWLSEKFGPRAGLGVGGAASLVAAVVVAFVVARRHFAGADAA